MINETSANRKYFVNLIQRGGFGQTTGDIFIPHEPYVSEYLWLELVDRCHIAAEGGLYDDLSIMDTYMAGIVRWLRIDLIN